jgi:heme-degrading monooxygenase HmoA
VEAVVLDGQDALFEAALCEVRQRAFMMPVFRGLTVAQGAEQAAVYLVQVRWETVEELQDVVGTDRFQRCWAPVQPLMRSRAAGRPLRRAAEPERPSSRSDH